MNGKEQINVYVPKTLNDARKLFERFKQLNLENLDKERFFFLFERGNGEVGFCVRHNIWQVCNPEDELFDVILSEI